jgi:hypothetical protein
MPLAFTLASSRSIVSFGPRLLFIVVNPSIATVRSNWFRKAFPEGVSARGQKYHYPVRAAAANELLVSGSPARIFSHLGGWKIAMFFAADGTIFAACQP